MNTKNLTIQSIILENVDSSFDELKYKIKTTLNIDVTDQELISCLYPLVLENYIGGDITKNHFARDINTKMWLVIYDKDTILTTTKGLEYLEKINNILSKK